jgi:hypothetical protein
MQPPICSLCHRDQRDKPELDFETVRFSDYEPIDRPGHPEGLHWFCAEHLKAAQALSDLTSAEALRRLREES